MNRLLIIDDDRELCELLENYLTLEGFEVHTVHEPYAGVEQAVSGQFDLVVLDVMLPQINGFEVLRRIRGVSKVAVLMLTARGDDVDRIVGLEIGADDYLPKPFNSRELVARIRAVLRRTEYAEPPAEKKTGYITVGDMMLDTGTRTVFCTGQPVDLTSIEFSILEVLLSLAGQVVSRDELLRRAMGRGNSTYDRSIDVHISSLRKKLGYYSVKEERIKTVRNVGYLYVFSKQDQ